MIKAALLDMDNTLLRNPDARFAAAFRKLWHGFFQDECGVETRSTPCAPAFNPWAETLNACRPTWMP